MSLDVYLNRKRYLSYDEGKTYTKDDEQVYWANITHNLGKMAGEAGIYEALWRPHRLKEGYNILESDHQAEWKFEEENKTTAKYIIPLLEKGLADLKSRPEHFEKFNSPNGWGMYEHFVPFVEKYLEACKEYPDAIIEVSR
ncbi:MAG: hypothetical protein KA536_22010 [Saprospiraceae bacterium]|nr:hypothetical protein [Saprospiraceae bacterium]